MSIDLNIARDRLIEHAQWWLETRKRPAHTRHRYPIKKLVEFLKRFPLEPAPITGKRSDAQSAAESAIQDAFCEVFGYTSAQFWAPSSKAKAHFKGACDILRRAGFVIYHRERDDRAFMWHLKIPQEQQQ